MFFYLLIDSFSRHCYTSDKSLHLPHGLLPWGEELPYTYGSRTPRGLWAKSSGGSSFLLPLLFPPLLIGPHLGGELPRVQGGIVVGAAWIKLSPMVASAAGLPRLVERGVVLGAGRIKALGLAGSGAGVVMTPAIRCTRWAVWTPNSFPPTP